MAAQIIPSDAYGVKKRLGSPIFTIAVGPERKIFHCHEAVLSQSAVFGSMCTQPRFEEGRTRQINLPEELPATFELLLEYLYCGEWEVASADPFDAEMKNYVDLYILADRYAIVQLKAILQGKMTTVVTELQAYLGHHGKPLKNDDLRDKHAAHLENFFGTMKRLYDNMPDSDKAFRTFYIRVAERILASHATLGYTGLYKWLEEGDAFAVDTFISQRNAALVSPWGTNDNDTW